MTRTRATIAGAVVTVAISLEGGLLQFATPLQVAANRYYLPLATLGRGDDGYPHYSYSPYSPLQRVVDALMSRGYTFVDIGSL